MRIESDVKLDFKDVLIRPKRSALPSRKNVDVGREFDFRWSKKHFTGVPIIAGNMDGVGTMAMAEAFIKDGNGMTVDLHKHYKPDDLIGFFGKHEGAPVWYSIGIADTDIEKLKVVLDSAPQKEGKGIEKICIDVANGYSEQFVDFVKRTRELVPNMTIMAGNVVTGEMVEELTLAGADVVKVGIGPGSVCTTRIMTGVGYQQLSAIIECADAAHGLGGLVCSDGGCTTPGDLSKAFGAGADFVMLGGMLAGHDQCEGQVIEENGEKSYDSTE
jgi:GMP reductase